MLPLLAIAVYDEPAVSGSVVGVDFFYCCLFVQVQRYSVVHLARMVEYDGPWPKVMRSRVAWMVVSAGSLPVTKHYCSWDALTRANEIIVAGS